jgi:hypothetical protein
MLWLREQVAQKNAIDTIPIQSNLIQGSIVYERSVSNLKTGLWYSNDHALHQMKALESCFNVHISEQSPQGLHKLLLEPKEKVQESRDKIKIENLLN